MNGLAPMLYRTDLEGPIYFYKMVERLKNRHSQTSYTPALTMKVDGKTKR